MCVTHANRNFFLAASIMNGSEPGKMSEATRKTHEAIRDLLTDEFADLEKKHGDSIFKDPYLNMTSETFRRYIVFGLKTWGGVLSSFGRMIRFKLRPYLFFELLAFTIVINTVLLMGVTLCLVVKFPLVNRLMNAYLAKRHNGVDFTNIINARIYQELTPDEIQHAKTALESSYSSELKTFDLDIAKLLLVCASLMYERTSNTTRETVKQAHTLRRKAETNNPNIVSLNPGGLLEEIFGDSAVHDLRDRMRHSPQDSLIQAFARTLNIEYEPISELSSVSSAYSALFWDPKSNWIILAFKGTSPSEFDEWITDFDVTRVPAGDDLPGYHNIHRGFKDRLFPDKPIMRPPYETIVAGIKIVAAELLAGKGPDAMVNVYFTGHSLGCAIATLTYARMIDNADGLDPRIHLRDAYLFAAPVVCDMASVQVFNERLSSDPSRPKTMWRVTNGKDAVAVSLPDLGDDPNYPYPDSVFGFAHLGTEVKMRPIPMRSLVKDHYLPDLEAVVASRLDPTVVGFIPENEKIPKLVNFLQYLPIMGRVMAHFPGYYWEALSSMGLGPLEIVTPTP